MPELAEVEFFRRQWDCGIGQPVLAVELHPEKRLFRNNHGADLAEAISGATLLDSEARGKQLLFRFSRQGWLGIHLGMTGAIRCEAPDFAARKHDHLVLRQQLQALVLSDARLFGRVVLHLGPDAPEWWSRLPPSLTSSFFTAERMRKFLRRHRKAPVKAVLLMQEGFPGIGNWMADEILWRAGICPKRRVRSLNPSELAPLFRQTRWVCRHALRIVAKDYSDPPASWLFRHRWEKAGRCPKHRRLLNRARVAGRTTVWCTKCQPGK